MTTACIRRTRNTTSNASTRASAAGRGSWRRWPNSRNNNFITAADKPMQPGNWSKTWTGFVGDGIRRFDPGTALYIKPMYWAEQGGALLVSPDPESTNWCLSLFEAPMREPQGFSVTLSPFRRPTADTAPVDAKTGALYPNNARALIEARGRGFDNCLVCDMLGNIAELATANIFLVKDGVVFTPAANGTFLAGITRTRVI